jgi:hypothetical protein
LKLAALNGHMQVSILRHMHCRGFVSIDVKPQNFMTGYGEKAHVIHVVDLGCIGKAGDILRNAGTLAYMSISSHQGQGTLS